MMCETQEFTNEYNLGIKRRICTDKNTTKNNKKTSDDTLYNLFLDTFVYQQYDYVSAIEPSHMQRKSH